MINALKSEFRKILTVRSTYVLTGILFILAFVGSFYGQGFNSGQYDENYLAQSAFSAATATFFFGAIIAVLHMAHEYRHNTIVYSLTLNRSRSKVLAAKIITIIIFVSLLTIITLSLSMAFSLLGASVAGNELPDQNFNALEYYAKAIFYCTGFALAGLLFATLIRNITASIAVLFIVPNLVEGLIGGLLLKENAGYLPFSALQRLNAMPMVDYGPQVLSPGSAAIVFLIYLLAGWALAWWLFIKRDAN